MRKTFTRSSSIQSNPMMLLQNCNFSRTPFLKTGNNFYNLKRNYSKPPYFRLRCVSELACNTISVNDIADVLHNKVIVAATVSAVIGQLSKPFTCVLLYGKKFDLKAAVQAGGFPSTHSSAAVATATSLVLERGFSDAIFGLAVVYASLIMYDAQGVRREVGTHAKELNKVLQRTPSYSTPSSGNDPNNSFSRESSSSNKGNIIEPNKQGLLEKKSKNSSVLLKYERPSSTVISDVESGCSPLLKESIGHTEFEVGAGALLGFLVSLAICPYV